MNAVCPAYVDSPMTERTLENVRQRTGLDAAQALAAVLASGKQSRLVIPDEVAARVIELCGETAGSTTGEAVVIRPTSA